MPGWGKQGVWLEPFWLGVGDRGAEGSCPASQVSWQQQAWLLINQEEEWAMDLGSWGQLKVSGLQGKYQPPVLQEGLRQSSAPHCDEPGELADRAGWTGCCSHSASTPEERASATVRRRPVPAEAQGGSVTLRSAGCGYERRAWLVTERLRPSKAGGCGGTLASGCRKAV